MNAMVTILMAALVLRPAPLCYAVARNSRAIQKDFAYFCSAITHYRDPP